ncbi:MAG: hypothetical protein JSS72_05485 [Armatimonadetes bacterium]|nr:hypothetical protein [Armatimonadota bacterium]
MRRLLTTLLLVLASISCFAEGNSVFEKLNTELGKEDKDYPNQWDGRESVFKKKYNGKDYDAIARMEITYSWSLKPKYNGEPEDIAEDKCTSACQGGKHKEHKECDTSCDKACTVDHKKELKAMSHFAPIGRGQGRANGRQIREKVTAIAKDMDIEAIAYWNLGTSDKVAEIQKAMKEKIKVDPGHPSKDKPCTSVAMRYVERPYTLNVQVNISVIVRDVTGKKETIRSDEINLNCGSVYVTDPTPLLTDTVNCLCKEEKPKTATGLPRIWDGSTYDGFLADNSLEGYNHLSGYVNITGQNMNYCTVGLGEMTQLCEFPAGTIFVPDDGSSQRMVLSQDVFMTNPRWGPLASMIPGFTQDSPPMKVRVLCTQMGLHEPSSRTHFRPAVSVDPVVAQLARMTAASHFHGPWDQMRMWIHTDRASYDQIKTRLIPCPGGGRYRELAEDVYKVETDPAASAAIEKNITADILFQPGTREDAVYWAAEMVASRDPGSLINAARQYGDAVFQNPDTDYVQFAAYLTNALLANPQKESHEAGFILLDHLPKAMVEQFRSLGGLDQLEAMVFEGTEADELKALQYFQKFGIGDLKDSMAALAATTKSEKIKALALQLGS